LLPIRYANVSRETLISINMRLIYQLIQIYLYITQNVTQSTRFSQILVDISR